MKTEARRLAAWMAVGASLWAAGTGMAENSPYGDDTVYRREVLCAKTGKIRQT